MQRFCFSLDLQDDPAGIERYLDLHRAVWPEILESIRSAGVEQMQIYRLGRRLFMVMDTVDGFSHERKIEMDRANPKVQEWERLMEEFQLLPDGIDRDEKWRPMERVFDLLHAERER